MHELNQKFTDLFKSYSEYFRIESYEGSSRIELMKLVPKDYRGVYSYWRKGEDKPFYIGCAGKIAGSSDVEGNTLRSRMFSSSTPYHFSKEKNCLFYGPTTAGVPPEGYKSQIDLGEIRIIFFIITGPTAPAALEHLLIQGYINEFGKLPDANQKI